jgi:hypothetical protein
MLKAMLRPIWTYGIQLWCTASTSNIEILERSQSKALRIIVVALWYVRNTVIRIDLIIIYFLNTNIKTIFNVYFTKC